MPTNVAQRSFAKGEIAPAMYARTDQVAYATGLRICRNMRVLRQGGVENRPGSVLVGGTPSNNAVRLLPFIFNAAQTYVLEFSDRKLRLIRQGGFIGGGLTPYAIATPYAGAELAELRIAQSADVVTITHASHPIMELKRHADDNWTLAPAVLAPAIDPPSGVTLTPTGTLGATFCQWVVTAIDRVTGQESFPSAVVATSSLNIDPTRRMLSWTAGATASEYRVYKGGSTDGSIASDFGFIGSTSTTTFNDTGFVPDMLQRAPVPRDPFASADNYPTAVTYFQGRRIFGGTNDDPANVWATRAGDYGNFTVSIPPQDDDALTLTLVSSRVGTVAHLVDHAGLYAFTNQGEWLIGGDQSGILRPTDLSALNFSKFGANRLYPIVIGPRILFVHARQTMVRDIARHPVLGYQGNDLTLMSVHLFDGHTIVDWSYQEIPHSIVWCVREDGVLLGLTDVAEQQILGWHRHDTLGRYENVCCVPEGAEDAVYVCVNRNGQRYIERFASRYFSDVADAIFMDAALSYDGRNSDPSQTVTIAGGTTWGPTELLTLNANAHRFTAGDVGNAFFLTGTDTTGAAIIVRFRISQYVGTTQVKGFADRDVPTTLQNVPRSSWSRAVDQVGGLQHLDGLAVSVLGDGNVVASPNNAEMAPIVVSGGIATLDQPYAVIHVGLPFVSDVETLDIDTPEGPSMKERRMLLTKLIAIVQETRGIFAGEEAPDDDSIMGLYEFKARDLEAWNESVRLTTDTIEIGIAGAWQTAGRVFLRQVDPLPLTVLGLIPTGAIPSPS